MNDYAAYLRSDEWCARRDRALQAADNRCTFCAATRRLQVHHLTYRRVGNERDEDLLVLCRACHERTHGLKRSRLRKLTKWLSTNVAERQRLQRENEQIEAEADRALIAVATVMHQRYRPIAAPMVAAVAKCHPVVAEETLKRLCRDRLVARVGAGWIARRALAERRTTVLEAIRGSSAEA